MNRRSFLSLLGMAAAGAALPSLDFDPERLLWVPGAKTFFIPEAPSLYSLDTIGWLNREALRILESNLAFAMHVNQHSDDAWKRSGHTVMIMNRSRWKPDRPAACGVLSE